MDCMCAFLYGVWGCVGYAIETTTGESTMGINTMEINHGSWLIAFVGLISLNEDRGVYGIHLGQWMVEYHRQ